MSLPQQNIHRAVEAGLWFDDGNIILIAEDTPFKVHRGMLMHTSEVLKDILSIPQPPVLDDSEMMDGIAIVHVSDTWKDLSYMLSALYGGYKLFGDGNPLPFTVISALLRLGHKYNIPGLQESATIRLRACFPETLESFKNSLTTDLGFTEDGYLRFEPPLIRMRLEEVPEVINIARAYNLPTLLRPAFYLCSQIPTEELIKGYTDQDGTLVQLSKDDLATCISGSISLMQHEIIEVSTFSSSPTRARCSYCDLDLLFPQPSPRWAEVIENAGASLQSSSWLDPHLDPNFNDVCTACNRRSRALWEAYRRRTWAELPQIFGIEGEEAT